MLSKQFSRLDEECRPILRRFLGGREVTHVGGCPWGENMTLQVELPRTLGAAAVVLRVIRDGEPDRDIPLSFVSAREGNDRYEGILPTAELCAEEGGLLFWELLFLRGVNTLFSNSVDNWHFSLSSRSKKRFRLLVYRPDFGTPPWLGEGTMYHIFLDRFCRGHGEVRLRPDAVENPDWEHGLPQFAPRPGDPLPNNVFFGGNLWGVSERLDFLSSLGVTVLYLSPIFEAASNHRYDTGDYERVDAYLGGEKAFSHLAAEAHRRGMRILLDGVFNHTGSDSRYFNREGHYPGVGADQSPDSPYADWYTFRHFPDDYECWWGIRILPRLNQHNASCRHYFTAPDGIACRWLEQGADGWRLDVADELPDIFLDELRQAVKAKSGGQAALIGEVWENAADKVAYGQRRRYLQGGQLDSVMNYPFRDAVLALLCRGDTEQFVRVLTEIYATYPRQVSDSLMNLLGTHDTPRILTLLGDDGAGEGKTNAELSVLRLTPEQRARAVRLLKIASVLQFTVYGFPSVYYGDEAGLEGYGDPFCRLPYPWDHQDAELLAHYRALGQLRRTCPALHGGDFRILFHTPGSFLYERTKRINRSGNHPDSRMENCSENHSDSRSENCPESHPENRSENRSENCETGDSDHFAQSRLLVALNLSISPVSYPIPGCWTNYFTGEKLRDTCTLAPGTYALLLSDDT